MKKCVTCGMEIPPQAPYCPQCGASAMLMQSLRLMTGNKGLDMLVGFGISFGLLMASGIILSLLATWGVTVVWLYYLPFIGTLLATLATFRRLRFVALGMLIPLLVVLLIVLGILLLCGGLH